MVIPKWLVVLLLILFGAGAISTINIYSSEGFAEAAKYGVQFSSVLVSVGVLIIAGASATSSAKAADSAAHALELQDSSFKKSFRPWITLRTPSNTEGLPQNQIEHTFVIPIGNFGAAPGLVNRIECRLTRNDESWTSRTGLGLSGFTVGMLMPNQQEELKIEILTSAWELVIGDSRTDPAGQLSVQIYYSDPSSGEVYESEATFETPHGNSRWSIVA